MTKRLIRYILLFFGLILIGNSHVLAQKEPVIVLNFNAIETGGKKVAGVEMKVYKGGTLVASATSANSGKFSKTTIPFNEVYRVEFSKPGYVSKSIEIDAKKGYHKDDIERLENYIDAPIELFQEQPAVDYSLVTSTPVGRLRIEPSNGQLDIDAAYTSKRSKEIEKFLSDLNGKKEELDKKFNDLVKEGDKNFTTAKYEDALTKYKEAQTIKPNDATVQQKIVDTQIKLDELAKQKQTDENFNKLIQQGDQLVASSKFDEAIQEYQKAQALKPNDKLPPQKIKEANDKKIAAQNSEKDKLYVDKMKEAKTAFDDKDYAYAKTLYKAASDIKPTEKEPKDKIVEIDKLIASQVEAEKKYNELMDKGEKALVTKNFDEAIKSFTDAGNLKPTEQRPKDQLALAQKLKNEADVANSKEQQYKELIVAADKLLGTKDYENAKSKYQEALGSKPNDAYATGKVKEIEDILKKIAEEKAKNEQKEKQFQDLLTAGNGHFDKSEWEQAKAKYKEAQIIKSDDKFLNDRLVDVEKKIIAKQQEEQAAKAKRDQYDALIKKGESEFNSANYTQAKASFTQASDLFKDEKYPKDKLDEIERKLSELADNQAKEAAEKAKRAEYEALVAKADNDFTGKKWEDAKTKYNEALGMYPNEPHPKKRLEEIEIKLKELAENKAKEEAEKAKRKQYDEFILAADGYFNSSNWEESKQKYNEALQLYPTEKHPKDRVDAINKKLTELADAKAKDEAEQVKRSQYDKLLADGNSAMTSEQYESALTLFKQAEQLYPNEQTPKEKITQINKIVADNKAKQEAEQAQLIQFNKLVSEADAHRSKNEWEKAREKYSAALQLRQDEPTRTKLNQVEATIAENQTAAQAQKAKREKYDQLISQAGNDFESQRWTEARQKFQEARELFPDEQLPPKKIAEIDKFLEEQKANEAKEKILTQYKAKIAEADAARDKQDWENAKGLYKQANGIKSDEDYPQQQIDWINEQMKLASKDEADKAYQKILEVADKKVAEKEYAGAKELYNRAIGLRPEDAYPKQKLAEIDKLIAEENANREKQKITEKYNEAIAKADAARDKQDWENAKGLYKQANGIKSDEDYPQQQIDWINEQMKLASKDEADKAYQKVLDAAENKLAAKDYDGAIELYKRASSLRSEDPLPKQKIVEIEKLKLEDTNNKITQQYRAKIAEADAARDKQDWENAKGLYKQANGIKSDEDYPQQQINWINEQMKLASKDEADKAYQKILEVADKKVAEKEYAGAKELYNRAIGLRPEDAYPKQKLAEIDRLIKEDIANKEKEQVNQRYNELIAQANTARDSEEWDKAKNLYKQAYSVKSTDNYPQEQIDWINKRMKEIANENVEKQYRRIIEAADNNFNKDELDEAKMLYNRALTLKPEDEYPKQKLREIDARYIERANQAKLNADKDKANTAYQNHLNRAKELEATEKYQQAITEYRNALGYKPEAPFPRQKIDELTDLLNKLAEEKRQKDEKDRLAKLGQTINGKDYYGEEVFDLNTDELEQSLKQSNIDQSTHWAEKVVEYNDQKTEAQHELVIQSNDKLDERNDELREVETKRIQEEINNDKPRETVVEQVEVYKDSKVSAEKIANEIATEKSLETESAVRQFEQKRANLFTDMDTTRQRVSFEVEQYKEKDIHSNRNLTTANEEKTYSTYTATEKLQEEWSQEKVDADKTRQNTVVSFEVYNNEKTEKEASRANGSTEKSFENKEQLNELEEKRIHLFDEADNTRETNTENLENYRDKKMVQQTDAVRNQTTQTYAVQQGIEKFKQDRIEGEVELDKPREQVLVDVEKYKDTKVEQQIELENKSENSTYATHQAAQLLEEKIMRQFDQADETRKRVTNEVENYQDEKIKQDEKTQVRNENKTYAAHQFAEELETKIAQQFIDADKTREQNTVSVEKYKDESVQNADKNRADYTEKNLTIYNQLDEKNTERFNQFAEADKTREANVSSFEKYNDVKTKEESKTIENFADRGLKIQSEFDQKKIEIEKEKLQADNTREKNTISMEVYQDEKYASNMKENEKSANKSVETYEAGEVLRTKINNQNKEADQTRELNATNVDAYKDARIDDEKEMTIGKDDKLLAQAALMEKVRTMDPQSLTEDFKNDIALAYGPGVTERKFQRKNARGEVIEITIERVVVVGNKGNVYKKVATRHGTTYFKNNGVISESIWDTETHLPTAKK